LGFSRAPARAASVFKKTAGMNPADWLISARVDCARELLQSSLPSVDAIAGECGFGNAITLRQHFRRKLGISPATYKARFAQPARMRHG